MAKLRICIMLLLFLCQILGAAYAIGISPSAMEMTYDSGKEVRLRFVAINTLTVPLAADIYVEGELADYASPEKLKLILKPKEAKEFFVNIKMPADLEPGPHGLQVGLAEHGNLKSGNLAGRAGVKANVVVSVPTAGKYLKIMLDAGVANVGEPLDFTLEMKNLGNETIKSISSTISIFESDKKLDFIDVSNVKNLGPLARTTLPATWIAFKGGNFVAVANVAYDDLPASAKAKFKVGNLVINILDISYDDVLAGAIGKVYIKLESKWNSKISDLFTEVFIYKDGEFVARFNSRPTDIAPWDTYTDTVYIDTKGFQPGVYEGKAIVHYADRTTEQTFKLALRGTGKFSTDIYVMIIILAISALMLAAIYLQESRQRRKKK